MSLDFLKDAAEFKELVRTLEHFREERPRLSLSGVNEAARPYFLAMLAIRIIYIQTSDRPLAELEERCRFFLDKLGVSRNVKALPSLTENPYGGAPPSLEDVASRTRFFYDLKHRPPVLVLTNLFGLLRPFPGPGRLDRQFVRLERGAAFERDRLIEQLAEFGYVREDLLAFRGEYAYRGGVVDAFSPWHPQPFRIEFSGDEIASIREFDPASQRTIRKIERCVIPALVETVDEEETVPYTAYLGDAVLIVESPENVEREYAEVMDEIREQAAAAAASGQSVRPPEHYFPPALWSTIRSRAIRAGELAPEETRGDIHFGFQSVPRFDNRIAFFLSYMKKLQEERERCLIFLSTATMRSKVMSLLAQESVPARAVD
jgi:transcription-repair coupling factor (superfamily II helicase)